MFFFLFISQYPVREKCDLEPNESKPNCVMALSYDTKYLSPAGEDLLKRLLQPNSRKRLRSIFDLQRIAFYLGHDVRNYTLKEVSTCINCASLRDESSKFHGISWVMIGTQSGEIYFQSWLWKGFFAKVYCLMSCDCIAMKTLKSITKFVFKRKRFIKLTIMSHWCHSDIL